MTEPVLAVESISHAYGEQPVLSEVDLDVRRGELLVILGPSGGGKSTLLRAIAGLVTPQGGTIRLDGELLCERGQERIPIESRRIGLCAQHYALFGHLSVLENVRFGVSSKDYARVDALLESAGLADLAARRPSELSGGQQQRVALLRALAPHPRLLLLDEPFANVDRDLGEQLSATLRRILRQEGATALLVTHDRAAALGLADRVAILTPTAGGGRIAQVGAPAEVYRTPISLEVARLTGPCSILTGEAAGGAATTSLGDVALLGEREGPVDLLLRPEQIRCEPAGRGLRVKASVFEGRSYRVHLEGAGAQGATLELTGESREDLEPGREVGVRLETPLWAFPP